MKKILSIKILIAAALGLMISVGAKAANLNGDIVFAGTATLNSAAASATTITFTAGTTVGLGSTGDYAGIPNGTTATFNNLNLGSVGYTGALAVNDLWSVTHAGVTYTFDLEFITSNSVTGSALVINGYGTADSTSGSQDPHHAGFYIRTTESGSETSITFAASSDVPDSGTTVAFLGLSLLGLAGVSRRLRK